jgi:peptide/nickel transport system substrate-binding protein
VTDSTSADEVIMRAFPRYYRGAPTIDGIRWKLYPTVRTAWAAMMRGDIDFLYEVGQDTQEFIQGESTVAVFPFLRNYVYALALNSKREAFKDWRVRQALNRSVDRDAIVAQGFKGHATPASGTAWPQHWAYDSTVPGYSYEPERASALLDAAGVPAATQAESGGPPARLRFTCIFPEGFPLWESIGLLVQRNFSAIGVDMRLETVTFKDFNSRIAAGEFDAVLSEFIVGNSPSRPFTFWYSGGKQNFWGYMSRGVDEALDGIRRASNDEDYKNAFRKFQLEIFDNPPAVFLALGETSRAVNKRFKVVAPAGSDILPTIADWQIAVDSTRMTN